MRLNIVLALLGLSAACLLAATACNIGTSVNVPPAVIGEQPPGTGTELAPPAFLSADRTIMIRDDVEAGHAALTVTTDRDSTFVWSLEPADLLQIDPATPLSDVPRSTSARLAITGVLRDPGPAGTDVAVTVVVTDQVLCARCLDDTGNPRVDADGDPVYCNDAGEPLPSLDADGLPVRCDGESTTRQVTLQVRRPAGPLVVSLASKEGSTVAPGESLTLRASISGGKLFDTDADETCVGLDPKTPPEGRSPYRVVWTLNGLQDETLKDLDDVDFLNECQDKGEEQVLSLAQYTAPARKIGNVLITVAVSDASGNRVSQTLPIVAASTVPLAVADASSERAQVAPGETIRLTAAAQGGESPYSVTFKLLGDPKDLHGSLIAKGCVEGTTEKVCKVGKERACNAAAGACCAEGDNACAAKYQAPADWVGPVLVRAEIKDAVGATVSATIVLTVASSEQLTISAVFEDPSVTPNQSTPLRATVNGGTPPYTICFGVNPGGRGGRLSPNGDAGCGPIDTLTNCVCKADSGPVTVERTYGAPGDGGTDSVTVTVRDNVRAVASDVESVNISSFGGPSPTGPGTGTVSLSASATNAILCFAESTTITATASGGSGVYTFTFAVPGAVAGESVSGSGATATYRAPNAQAGPRTILVTVSESGGSTAQTPVAVTSKDPATCADGNACTRDVCTLGVCSSPFEPAGTTCGSNADTECDNPDTCNGAGLCVTNPEPGGTTCGSATDTDCDNADSCDGAGACAVNHEINGAACTSDGVECTADVCNAGVCTHPSLPPGTLCGNPLNSDCTDPDTCDGSGVCLANHVAVGTLCGNPTDNECTDPDTCDGAGACTPNNAADGSVCASDGNECTLDACASGVCAHPNVAVNTPCGDPTDNACTDADTCDGAGVCRPNHALANAPCGSPTDTDCTNPDTCDGAGACAVNHEINGAACASDGVECTADVCNAGVCTHSNLIVGTFCGDPSNTVCTAPDTCNGSGACLPNHAAAGTFCGSLADTDCTDPDRCDGSGACNPSHAANGTLCNDGLFCTQGEFCTTGACGGGVFPCDDGIGCTDDSCSEATDSCVSTPNNANCPDDGVFCNGTESCHAVSDCVHSGDPCPPGDHCNETSDACDECQVDGHCNDHVGCTDDTCAAGTCVYTPNNANCPDDGLFCDGVEFCDAVTGCGSTGDPCVPLVCDEGGDQCITPCPAGPVTFADPQSDTIDARQPYPPNDAAQRQGISSILVQGPPGIDNLTCWSLCETVVDGTPNTITGIVDNGGGMFTVNLARTISVGAVTAVTYTEGGGPFYRGVFTSHPGNVNADGASNAADILAITDILNLVLTSPWGSYSCDVDQSGVCGPSDIPRVIDLLNGADQFDPWLGISLPLCGACCP